MTIFVIPKFEPRNEFNPIIRLNQLSYEFTLCIFLSFLSFLLILMYSTVGRRYFWIFLKLSKWRNLCLNITLWMFEYYFYFHFSLYYQSTVYLRGIIAHPSYRYNRDAMTTKDFSTLSYFFYGSFIYFFFVLHFFPHW